MTMGMHRGNERQYKICLLGESGVGKTCVITRFVKNTYSDAQPVSMGVAYTERVMEVESVSYKLQIWDIAGQAHYSSLAPIYYRGADAAVLTFDITYKGSFLSIDNWIKELRRNGPDGIVVVLVGNKSDMEELRQVFPDDIDSYAEKQNILYFETSAKTGENIEDVFQYICKSVPDKKRKNLMELAGSNGNTIKLDDINDSGRRKKCC